MVSHSGALAVNPHPRNVPDDVLRRIAENGGVVMVPLGAYFVSPAVVEHYAAEEAERARLEAMMPGAVDEVEARMTAWEEAHPAPEATIADVVDHIDHIRDVAGIEHVGIGSDYDGISQLPVGLEDVSCFPHLVAELLRRGYSREDVEAVVGLNVLRVMERAEAVAAQLRGSEKPSDARFEDFAVEGEDQAL